MKDTELDPKLAAEYFRRVASTSTAADTAQTIREKQRELMRKRRASGRDITLPPVRNPQRRASCENDLFLFGKTYFPDILYLEPCAAHHEVAANLQRIILYGGLQAQAAPRGFGKDMWTSISATWGILYGHLKFCLLGRANKDMGIQALNVIKHALSTSEPIAEDFPEVAVPVRELEGIPQRAHALTYDGKPTGMHWGSEEIVLPRIPGKPSSGARLVAFGLSGAIRGFVREGGLRPDFWLVSDAEDDDSVRSATQTQAIARRIEYGLGGVGGPGKTVSGVMLCTILRKGCVADEFTNPEVRPAFNGRRYAAIIKPPDRQDLWDKYIDLRREGKQTGDDPYGRAAHRFYLENRADMDAGAEVLWPANYQRTVLDDGTELEASNLQGIHNEIADKGEEYFFTELQNKPPENDGDAIALTPADVVERTNGLPQSVVPSWAAYLTEGVDVGAREVHYCVIAHGDNGSSAVIDYAILATELDRNVSARPGQMTSAEREAVEMRILQTLRGRQEETRYQPYRNEDGKEVPIRLRLIDCGYAPAVIHRFVRESGETNRAAKGFGRGHTNGRFRAPRKSTSDRITGEHYYVERVEQYRGQMWGVDADHWKQYTHERFRQSIESPGACTLFGDSSSRHRTYGFHITAERWDPEKDKFVQVRAYNHWLDATALAHCAGHMAGVRLIPEDAPQRVAPQRKPRPQRGPEKRRGGFNIGRRGGFSR